MKESITKRKHGRLLKEKPKDGRYSGQYPSKGSSQTSFDYEFKQVGKNSFELLNVDDLECPLCIEIVTEPIRLRSRIRTPKLSTCQVRNCLLLFCQ